MQFVDVEVPGEAARAYEIVIGTSLPEAAADDLVRAFDVPRWAVITDSTVAPLYGDPLAEALRGVGAKADCLVFPAGEAAKTRATAAEVQDRLIQLGHGRDSWIVAVGGGVVGDLAGFVAATLFRGVPYVQVPTTLLAMVDSSVGGKTGVDTDAGKNLVGAFLQPRRVLVDVDALQSLPRPEVAAGMAEVIKYGVILDAALFSHLEEELVDAAMAGSVAALEHIVARACYLKADVVAADEKETGYRQILNFGHTVGHAIEAVSAFGIRHGEAVAIGMVAEARLAARLVNAPADLAAQIAALCERAGLPTAIPDDCAVDALVEAAFRDKKVRDGGLRCALPAGMGIMAHRRGDHGIPVAVEDLEEVLGSP